MIVTRHADRASRLHTDESRLYPTMSAGFAQHETVHHKAGEYARGDVTTNSVEGFFGILKHGLNGVYQHLRACAVLAGIGGQRLTYRRVD